MSWKKIKLKQILKQYRIEHIVQNDVEYKQVTISKYDGVTFRGTKIGREIGRKRQFLIDLKKFPNTLMLVRQGVQDGSIGIAPLEVDGCIATENMPMFSVEGINLDYLKFILKSPYFFDELKKIETTGSAQKSIHEREILEIEIPFPEIEEQENIVVELLKKRERSLTISTELTHQLTLVKQLRQSFLREAMQGKLTAEFRSANPELIEGENSAQALLNRIVALAQSTKKGKELAPVSEDEIPFEIPESWVWCRLLNIGRISGGGTPSMANVEYWNGHIPWVSPKDMWTEIVSDTEMKVTTKGIIESSTNLIPIGSLLIVGRSGILKRKLPVAINSVECTVNQDMKVIIPHVLKMNRYVKFMLGGLESTVLKEFVKFGMTVHSLKYDEFARMPIPLPPLSEQQAIVSKLDELMRTCDELEASIRSSQQQNEMLLQQVLREALEG